MNGRKTSPAAKTNLIPLPLSVKTFLLSYQSQQPVSLFLAQGSDQSVHADAGLHTYGTPTANTITVHCTIWLEIGRLTWYNTLSDDAHFVYRCAEGQPELGLCRWGEKAPAANLLEEECVTRAITQCPVCRNTSLTKLPFEYWYQHEPFPGCRCSGCGLVFLSVQPDRDTLEGMYGEQYFESDFRCGSAPASYFATEEPFAREAGSALELIRETTGKKTGRLLEIGCAGGWFLKTARKAGWKVRGVEISKEAAEFARAKLGLDVFCGSLSEAAFPPHSFDVVYMADVLEHIPDPVSFAVELMRIIAPSGHVVVCGPTALNALWRRLGIVVYRFFKKTRSIAAAPYHLFEYNPRTIRRLFESVGFDVIHLRKRKIRPGLRARTLEDFAVFGIELINYPATFLFGVWSDRIVLCATPRSQG